MRTPRRELCIVAGGGEDALELAHESAQLVEAQGVGAVGESASGRFVDFEKQAVDSGGDGGAGQRRDELGLPARSGSGPPGICTLCVASKTTGQPDPRMMARPRMSTTRLL